MAWQIARSKSAAGPASAYVPNPITRYRDRNRGSRLSVPFAGEMKIVFGGNALESSFDRKANCTGSVILSASSIRTMWMGKNCRARDDHPYSHTRPQTLIFYFSSNFFMLRWMTSPGCHPGSVGAPAIGYGMHPLDEVPCARRVVATESKTQIGGNKRRCFHHCINQTWQYLRTRNIALNPFSKPSSIIRELRL